MAAKKLLCFILGIKLITASFDMLKSYIKNLENVLTKVDTGFQFGWKKNQILLSLDAASASNRISQLG